METVPVTKYIKVFVPRHEKVMQVKMVLPSSKLDLEKTESNSISPHWTAGIKEDREFTVTDCVKEIVIGFKHNKRKITRPKFIRVRSKPHEAFLHFAEEEHEPNDIVNCSAVCLQYCMDDESDIQSVILENISSVFAFLTSKTWKNTEMLKLQVVKKLDGVIDLKHNKQLKLFLYIISKLENIGELPSLEYNNMRDILEFIKRRHISDLSYIKEKKIIEIVITICKYFLKDDFCIVNTVMYMYPKLISESTLLGQIQHLLDLNVPLVSEKGACEGNYQIFYDNLKERSGRCPRDITDICDLIVRNIPLYLLQETVDKFSKFIEYSLNNTLIERCKNAFKSFSKKYELILRTWSLLSEQNRCSLLNCLQDGIQTALKANEEGCYQNISNACLKHIETLCVNYGVTSSLESQVKMFPLLALHTEETFLTVLHALKSKNAIVVTDEDITKYVKMWFTGFSKQYGTKTDVNFTELICLYNKLGKASKLLKKDEKQELESMAKLYMKKARVSVLLNESDVQAINDSAGIDIYFLHLASCIRDNIGHEDRHAISETALLRFTAVDQSMYQTQVLSALLDVSGIQNCKNNDEVIAETFKWFSFWKQVLENTNLDSCLRKHESIRRVKNAIRTLDERLQQLEIQISTLQLFENKDFLDGLCALHSFLFQRNPNLKSKIITSLNDFDKMQKDLKTIRDVFQAVVMQREAFLLPDLICEGLISLEEFQKQIEGGCMTMEEAMESEFLTKHANTDISLCKQCEQLKPLIASSFFWNVVKSSSVLKEKTDITDIQSSIMAMAAVAKMLGEGKSMFLKRWFEIQNSDDISIAEITKHLKIENIEHETQLLKDLTGHTDDARLFALSQLSNYQSFHSDICLVETCIVTLQIQYQTETDISKAFIHLRSYSVDRLDKLKFSVFSHHIHLLHSLSTKLQDKVTRFLREIIESKVVMEFLKTIQGEDLRNIIDAVEDFTDRNISIKTISSLLNIHQFMQPLVQPRTFDGVDVVIDVILRLASDPKIEDIYVNIKECIMNINGLKALYKNIANRLETTSSKATEIMKNGSFRFFLNEEQCDMDVTLSKGSSVVLSKAELSDLRSRALLILGKETSLNKVNDLATMEEHGKFQKFIYLVDLAFETLELYEQINDSGHFKYECFNDDVPSSGLEVRVQGLTKDLDEWMTAVEHYQRRYYEMQFLTFGHIRQIHRYLQNDNVDNEQSVQAIMFYINPEREIEKIETKKRYTPKTPKHVLDAIVHAFKMDDSNQTCVCTPRQSRMQMTNLKPDSDLVVRTLLASNYENYFPYASNVLICEFETGWDEIHLFLLRCANKISQNQIFTIAHVEALRFELQHKLSKDLQNHLNEKIHVIYCGKENEPFVLQFKQYLCPPLLVNNIDLKEWLKCNRRHMIVVTSTYAGLGKSEEINKESRKHKLTLKHLPLNGKISRELLVRKLSGLHMTKHDLLHIDIGVIGNLKELDCLLFQVVVLKYLASRRHSFYLPTDHVCIEIANTSKCHLETSLQFTMCLQQRHLVWDDFKSFTISMDINSPVQVFCHYIKARTDRTLHTTDLYFTGEKAIMPLSSSLCRKILKRTFQTKKNNSYTLVEIYLNVISDQLKKLSRSLYFRTEHLSSMVKDVQTILNVKDNMIKALMEMTNEIASRAVSLTTETENKVFGTLIEKQYGKQLRWEDGNHLLIVFNSQEHESISIMCKNIDEIPADIHSFLSHQMSLKGQQLPALDILNQSELKQILWKTITKKGYTYADMQEIMPSYVITADNLLKMVLINLKLEARIPVVIMGETGCGKTTLLEYLSKIKRVHLFVMNIHAGLKKEKIIQDIKSHNNKAMESIKSKIIHILFFDEINTSQHIGFLTDVIVHRHIDGQFLAPNLTIVASCNPYRQRDKNDAETPGLKVETSHDNLSHLVYRVYPLPETLLDYVWDFGNISEKDEKMYINEMVKFEEIPSSTEINWKDTFVNLVSHSQIFVKDNEKSECSVSLREVHRSKKLLAWFVTEYFKKIRKISNSWIDTVIKAMLLTLSLTYHSRFKTDEIRTRFWKKVSNVLENNGVRNFDEQRIRSSIKEEQKFLIEQMVLPEGIARNRTLQENVFTLFVCILRRIPICLVGKPGNSKSLSVQLLRENMRGEASQSVFFKHLPQLYFVTYQGSESSTSEGIEKVFKTADEYQLHNREANIQVVVLFDEIGLAYKSRFQPLKVLHSLLEPNNMEQMKIAVVGLSNWAMDPAKMNRLVHVSCPDMRDFELKDTGESIYCAVREKYIQDMTELECKMIRKIAENYVTYIKQPVPVCFHGGRDFYALVKHVSRKIGEIGNITEEAFWQIIEGGVERNFNGIPKRYKSAKSVLVPQQFTTKTTNIGHIIRENLQDIHSRHLMLICNSDAILGKLEHILEKQNKSFTHIYGSQFEEDQYDDYIYRILSKIIICMEEGHVLILKDLDVVYGSLYDMLNQNYMVIGKRKHCRIALGPYSNPLCYVHESFKCIVLVDESIIQHQNAPFLSRFEKQMLSFNDFMTQELQDTLIKLQSVLEKILLVSGNKIPHTRLIPIYEPDLLPSLIQAVSNKNQGRTPSCAECLTELLPIFQPEVMILLPNSTYWTENQEDAELLLGNYFHQNIHRGFKHYVSCIKGESQAMHKDDQDMPSSNLLESTTDDVDRDYEKSSDSITDDNGQFYNEATQRCFHAKKNNRSENKLLAIFTNSNIHIDISDIVEGSCVIRLGTLKSEKQLDTVLKQFWNIQSQDDMLVLQCTDIEDFRHVSLAKSRISFYRNEYLTQSNQPKHVCIITHLTRSNNTVSLLSTFNFQSEWTLVTLDCLSEPFAHIKDIYYKSITEIILHSSKPMEKFLSEQLLWAFTRLGYDGESRKLQFDDIKKISNILPIKGALKEKILTWINKIEKENKQCYWVLETAVDERSLQTFGTFERTLREQVEQMLRKPLASIVSKLEQTLSLHSLSKMTDDKHMEDAKLLDVWVQMFLSDKIMPLDSVIDQTGPSCFHVTGKYIQLDFPFSKFFLDSVDSLRSGFLAALGKKKTKHDLDDEDEITSLPDEEIQEVIMQHQDIVHDQLTVLLPHLTVEREDMYIDDFCRYYLSKQQLTFGENEKLYIFKWILFHLLDERQSEEDGNSRQKFIRKLTQMHATIWLKGSIVFDVLKIIETTTMLDENNLVCRTLEEVDEAAKEEMLNAVSAPIDSSKTLCDKSIVHSDCIEIYLRCLIDHIGLRMFPSSEIKDKNELRKWQHTVNSILWLAMEINVSSPVQTLLRFVHDLVCIIYLPHNITLSELHDFMKFIQDKTSGYSNAFISAQLSNFLKKIDVPDESKYKCLCRFALRSLDIDESNISPLKTILFAGLEDSHTMWLHGEPFSLSAAVARSLDETFELMKSDLDIENIVDQENILKTLQTNCIKNYDSCLSLLVADCFDVHLLSDIINEQVLSELCEDDHPLSKRIVEAWDAVRKSSSWSQYMLNVGIIRRFIVCAIDVIFQLKQNQSFLIRLLRDIVVNTVGPQALSEWKRFFIRALRNGNSSIELSKRVEQLGENDLDIRNFFDLDSDSYFNSFADLKSVIYLDLDIFKRMNACAKEENADALRTIPDDKQLLGGVLNIFHFKYLPQVLTAKSPPVHDLLQYIRNLPKTTLQNTIVSCFSIDQKFKIETMNLSVQSKDPDIIIAIFISQILISSAFLFPAKNIFKGVIENPALLRQEDIANYLLPQKTSTEPFSNCSKRFSCQCQNRVYTLNSMSHCPVCGVEIEEKEMKNDKFIFERSISVTGYTIKKHNCVVFKCMRLLLFGVIVSCRAIHCDTSITISDLFQKSDAETNDFLMNELEVQWITVSKLLNVSSNELLRLYAIILKKVSQSIHLSEMGDIINDTLQMRYRLLDEQICQLRVNLQNEKNGFIIEETEQEMQGLVLRRTFDAYPTLECLFGEIVIQNHHRQYPLLYLILKRLDYFKMMQFLAPFLKWHRTLAVLGSFYLRKCDCRTMSIDSFIKKESSDNKMPNFRQRFYEFMEKWNELFSGRYMDMLLSMNPDLKNIKQASEDKTLQDFLILDENSMLYKAIECLINIQNTFLDEVLEIACFDQCLAISFALKHGKSGNFASFPTTSAMEMQDEDILPSEFPDYAMVYSQRSIVPDSISRVVFDFERIEVEAVLHFLTKVKFIHLNAKNLWIQFQDDIAQNTIRLLKDFSSACPKDDKKEVDRSSQIFSMIKENNPEKNHNLLKVLGITAVMLSKEERKPDTSLCDYFQKRKNEFDFIAFEDAIPPEATLGDLVELYQLLEELNGEKVLNAIDQTFKAKITPDIEKVVPIARQQLEQWKTISVGIKLFAHRCLWNNKSIIRENGQLNFHMQDESFWKISVTVEERNELRKLINDSVKVKHVWELFEHIKSKTKSDVRPRQTLQKKSTTLDPNKTRKRKPLKFGKG